MEPSTRPLKVFISYSHKNSYEKNQLTEYLSGFSSHFELISDDQLRHGDDWNEILKRFREEADIFLLLVSPFYLSSKTINELEVHQIVERGESGAAYVIPVILAECEWNSMPFAKFQAVPKFGVPISKFKNREDAYLEISEALITLKNLILNNRASDIIKKCREQRSVVLNLAGCSLYNIPPDLLNMDWITHLHLQNNSLRKIEHLEKLAELTYLDLSDNEITDIENLDELEKLTYLDLERNRLTEVENLENNTLLTTLGLSTNSIENLSGVSHLQNLETFYAARNKINNVSELSILTNLKRIVLTDNPITSIRPLLTQINLGIPVRLKYALKTDEHGIFIKGNPIADPPLEVIALGSTAIRDHFLKSEQHGDKKLEIIKLILVGNSGVGKTNFSELLRKKKITKKHISTDTLCIQPWKAPFLKSESGNAMLVNIFDFGGQDYYHDLHRLYYSHDTAYILLWDTETNAYAERKEKLDDKTELIYEDFPLEYWLESIQYNLYGKEAFDFAQALQSENKSETPSQGDLLQVPASMPAKAIVKTDLSATAPVLVLQNKIDRGEGLLNQVSLREKYPNITTFFNMSIIEKKRIKILYEILDSCLGKLNLSGRKLVSYQHDIVEKYLQSNIPFEVLTLAEFKDKCAELSPQHQNVVDISDAKTIASVLTNIGMVYFDQPAPGSGGEGVVFTRIGELNDQIKKVMNEAKLGGDKGLFKYSQVSDFKYISHVLNLLIKNNSIIPLENDCYLVPQFLPVNADTSVESFSKAFDHCQIRYVYTAYFHKSILMSLFAKFLGKQNNQKENKIYIKGIYYWRNGLILSQDNGNDRPQMVFIKFIKEFDACRIELRTLYPFGRTGLEREIEKELDELNKGWSFSKEVSVNSKDFFEVNGMIKQANEKNFIFQKNNQLFTVNDFKDLVTFDKIPKKLFISYSSKNSEFVKRFWTHLDVLKSAGYIEPWYDRKIEAGSKWDDSIQKEMSSSHLVIFLLSPDFLNTPYIMNEELKNAIVMESEKKCELFFIQLLPSSWEDTDLRKYQMMFDPNQADKKQFFINTPGNDEAWKTIMNVLREKVKP